MKQQPKLIAIVGGSGAGKTWLARRLENELSPAAAHLSLDDFYCDRGSLHPRRRETVNYDHPRAIDWHALECVLRACRTGETVRVPRYDFATHTRTMDATVFSPGRVVLMDGLWLLARPDVRALFHFAIYLDCPTDLRLERRLTRDVAERGRQSKTVRKQFWKNVVPMHDRFVAPQEFAADIVLKKSAEPIEIENLAETIRALMTEDRAPRPDDFPDAWPMNTKSAAPPHQVMLWGSNVKEPVLTRKN